MKRNMDLVRAILFKLEENPHGFNNKPIEIEGYSREEIGYHSALMHNAGLIQGIDMSHLQSGSPDYLPHCLTWQGHEFLDACRHESIWVKAKEKIRTIGEDVPLDVFKAVLIDIMTKQLIGT